MFFVDRDRDRGIFSCYCAIRNKYSIYSSLVAVVVVAARRPLTSYWIWKVMDIFGYCLYA